jgi:hypothetical protein
VLDVEAWLPGRDGGLACVNSSGFAPFARLDVELHLPGGAHPEQQVLQGVRAFAARIEPLLQRIDRHGFFERGQYFCFCYHGSCFEIAAIMPRFFGLASSALLAPGCTWGRLVNGTLKGLAR